jgi:hypothetical protein
MHEVGQNLNCNFCSSWCERPQKRSKLPEPKARAIRTWFLGAFASGFRARAGPKPAPDPAQDRPNTGPEPAKPGPKTCPKAVKGCWLIGSRGYPAARQGERAGRHEVESLFEMLARKSGLSVTPGCAAPSSAVLPRPFPELGGPLGYKYTSGPGGRPGNG